MSKVTSLAPWRITTARDGRGASCRVPLHAMVRQYRLTMSKKLNHPACMPITYRSRMELTMDSSFKYHSKHPAWSPEIPPPTPEYVEIQIEITQRILRNRDWVMSSHQRWIDALAIEHYLDRRSKQHFDWQEPDTKEHDPAEEELNYQKQYYEREAQLQRASDMVTFYVLPECLR